MDIVRQLVNLSSQMGFEYSGESDTPVVSDKKKNAYCVSSALSASGKKISLLKTLLTSACERNCIYCPFRAGRNFHRISLKPDELASAFITFAQAGIVQGLFLSSGVAGGGCRTQDKLLETADILRNRYKYTGYIHLKLMPGVEKEQVLKAMQLSNRVSINLEAPNQERLRFLAPEKRYFDELFQPMRWVNEIRQSLPAQSGWNNQWPSLTTQFVVGVSGESDLELLSTTQELYKTIHLKRAYYSAFRPVKDTPLENLAPPPHSRETHLYQASFLLRDYGFAIVDLPFDEKGNLPSCMDPKLAWAQRNLINAPLEINRASREELLRVPGFGPKIVHRLLSIRRSEKITSLENLRKFGLQSDKALPFILLDGKQAPKQRSFW